jgi:hypothetical protein
MREQKPRGRRGFSGTFASYFIGRLNARRRSTGKSFAARRSNASPLHPCKRTFGSKVMESALCHVWTAPCWQGLFSRLQHWSVQPCVRPVSAVHMTAGHNALRGSGPGHKLAFEDALAHVGCPDRRIDRLCIYVLFALPTFTPRRPAGMISFTPPMRRVPCSVHP